MRISAWSDYTDRGRVPQVANEKVVCSPKPSFARTVRSICDLDFSPHRPATFPDTLVVSSTLSVATAMDPNSAVILELVIDGLADSDTILFRVRQAQEVAEITTSISAFRRSLVNGSSAQLAFDAVLSELRQDAGRMNVGLISTRPFGEALDHVDAYRRFEVATQTPSSESPVADYADRIRTDVGDAMYARNASAYLRIPFQVDDLKGVDRLLLSMQYDDGFVAYLNGQEIARRNAPDALAWNSHASDVRPDTAALTPEVIDVTASLPYLRLGNNLLAIHGLNSQADNLDFLQMAWLEAQQTTLHAETFRYFAVATPGQANQTGDEGLGPVVEHVEHRPSLPTEADPIQVTAKLVGGQTAATSMTLTYRVMYDDERSLPMRDDGQAPDEVSGDGVFTAEIPRGVARAGDMVRYFVTSQAEVGPTFRSPYLPEPTDTSGQPLYYGTVIAGRHDRHSFARFSLVCARSALARERRRQQSELVARCRLLRWPVLRQHPGPRAWVDNRQLEKT